MTVLVQPLVDTQISKLISLVCGPTLTDREAEVFDHCQTLGVVYTGFVDGEFVCCWGLIPPSFLANEAYLWMWSPENPDEPMDTPDDPAFAEAVARLQTSDPSLDMSPSDGSRSP